MLRSVHTSNTSHAFPRPESSVSGSGSSSAKPSNLTLYQRLTTCSRKDPPQWWLLRLLLTIAIVWLSLLFYSVCQDLFPEADMALHSSCNNPLQNWDGKVLDVPVWPSAYAERPLYHNLHFERHKAGEPPVPAKLTHSSPIDRPVIVWATHHKTGTFLAKKIFAKVCARMNWCCLFHVTRDSVFHVADVLHSEPVHALGHNQWVWHPSELNLTNYRLIHFYRNPFRKVVSGYNYHYDGTEQWTKDPLHYAQLCSRVQAMVKSASNVDGGEPCTPRGHHHHHHDTTRHHSEHKECVMKVDTDAMLNYCQSVHLCETCCRKEHEIVSADNSKTLDLNQKTFALRSPHEYAFMCEHLGKMPNASSVMDAFHVLPPQRGVVVESALDFYETLRMAHIVNQTVNDPHALNLDLDFLTADHDAGVAQILNFLREFIPKDQISSLQYDLKFYDLNNSPLYRWSMSNPFVNHVTQSKTNQGIGLTSRQLFDILVNTPEVMEMYGPIYDLMHAVVKKPKPMTTTPTLSPVSEAASVVANP